MVVASTAVMVTTAPVSAEYIFRHWQNGAASVSVQPPPPLPGTRIFMTAASYTGNLGGLSGADAKCMADANKPSDGRTYVALLSTATVAANSRVTITYPVRRTDNTVIDNANLWDGTLDARVSTIGTNPWTGTIATGAAAANNCTNWTSEAVTGAVGDSNRTDNGAWLNWIGTGSCNASRPFYCISTTGS